MAFGRNDAQTAQSLDLFVVLRPLCADGGNLLLHLLRVQRLISLNRLDRLADVAPEHNVGTPTGHVGGDGDHPEAARLRYDLGLSRVLLGVEHLVRQLFLFQQLRQYLRVFDRGGAHQHRLPALMALADVLDRSFVLFARGLVNTVELVFAPARSVVRHHHRLKTINFLKLVGFCIGRAGHARKLAVETEIVLERDGGHGLVFGLNGDTFLGFNRLMQAIAPAPARHQSAGELVNNHNLAVLHHIVLIAMVEMVGTQSCVQVMHQRDVGRVVQGGTLRTQPQA